MNGFIDHAIKDTNKRKTHKQTIQRSNEQVYCHLDCRRRIVIFVHKMIYLYEKHPKNIQINCLYRSEVSNQVHNKLKTWQETQKKTT